MNERLFKRFPKNPKIGDVMICKTKKTFNAWKNKLYQQDFGFVGFQNGPYFQIRIFEHIIRIPQDDWDRLVKLSEKKAKEAAEADSDKG